jgi:hypothetical protein
MQKPANRMQTDRETRDRRPKTEDHGEKTAGPGEKTADSRPNTEDIGSSTSPHSHLPPAPATPPEGVDYSNYPAVTHAPAHCPACGSSDSHITATRHPIPSVVFRYHICNSCQTGNPPAPTPFRSTEELGRRDARRYEAYRT